MAEATPCAECGAPTPRKYCTRRCNSRTVERRRRADRFAARYPNGRPPCGGCGADIPREATLNARWCSLRCKEAVRTTARRAARHAAMFQDRERPCRECGTAMGVQDDGHKRFCTLQCQHQFFRRKSRLKDRPAGVQLAARLCATCGALFLPAQANALYCGPPCRQKEMTRRAAQRWRDLHGGDKARRLANKRCERCAGPMANVGRTYAKFCGARCRVAATYQRTKVAHKAYRDSVRRRPEYREINRGYAHRRRARQAATMLVEITPEVLAQRMAMFPGCWMCGGPWAEVEHVKPLDKGGPHILANLRPSCGPCNRSKARTWLGVRWAMSLRRGLPPIV